LEGLALIRGASLLELSMAAEMVRKKVRWATKRRKGNSRVWKTRWIKVPKTNAKTATKPAAAKTSK